MTIYEEFLHDKIDFDLRDHPDGRGETAANAQHAGPLRAEGRKARIESGEGGDASSDADCSGLEGSRHPSRGIAESARAARWGGYWAAVSRWERVIGERAPDPLDGKGRLNVELTRWMLGAPPGWHDHPHGGLSRSAAIRGYGNGVVVQLAEEMGRWLLEGL